MFCPPGPPVFRASTPLRTCQCKSEGFITGGLTHLVIRVTDDWGVFRTIWPITSTSLSALICQWFTSFWWFSLWGHDWNLLSSFHRTCCSRFSLKSQGSHSGNWTVKGRIVCVGARPWLSLLPCSHCVKYSVVQPPHLSACLPPPKPRWRNTSSHCWWCRRCAYPVLHHVGLRLSCPLWLKRSSRDTHRWTADTMLRSEGVSILSVRLI